jgi:hypothetical protein
MEEACDLVITGSVVPHLGPQSHPLRSHIDMGMEIWTYRESMPASTDILTGFAVEATDGSIGHVDSASNELGAGYIVVDTGPWIFGRNVMIPAGAISHVDLDEERVMLDLTKQQIKDSPEFDPTMYHRPPS